MTLATAVAQGARLLEEAGIAVPKLTAEVLLAYALRRDRTYLIAHGDDELPELGWIHYGRYLHQRLAGVPTQYITRRQEFYGRDFLVTPAVLIPRPETEHLVEHALDVARDARRIVDIGCGSGAIGLTLALELRRPVLLGDLSFDALAVAQENARRLQAPAYFLHGDLTSALADRSIDLVVSNPPYIPLTDAPTLAPEVREQEPHLALFAGPDGLDAYRRLIADASRVLAPGGRLMLELDHRAAPAVAAMLDARFEDRRVLPDLAGHPRVFSTRFIG